MRYLVLGIFLLMPKTIAADSEQTSNDRIGLVSMVQLLANPEEYNEKAVEVIGFLRLEFEGNELYLHEDDYLHGITKNGLWIDLSPDLRDDAAKLNMHYVLVGGTFSAKKKGHMSMASGSINASIASVWPNTRLRRRP